MKLVVFFKQGDAWVRYEIVPPENSGSVFFTKLKLRLMKELDSIKSDLRNILGVEGKYIAARPKVSDPKKQKIVNILVQIRKVILESLEISRDLSSVSDCIVCDRCGSIMYKFPENVGFVKIGKSYMITEKDAYKSNIEYIYCCSECNACVAENIYNEKQSFKEQREKLLRDGYNWVPTNSGYYYWEGDEGNKHPNAI